MRTLFVGAIAAVGLFTTMACTPPPEDTSTASEEPAALESVPEPEQPIERAPLTYNGPEVGIPVMARYPNTMSAMDTGSGEGVAVFFTFEP